MIFRYFYIYIYTRVESHIYFVPKVFIFWLKFWIFDQNDRFFVVQNFDCFGQIMTFWHVFDCLQRAN